MNLLVPQEGIEPPRPKAHDFESCASTSSATEAVFKNRLANLNQKRSFQSCSVNKQYTPILSVNN